MKEPALHSVEPGSPSHQAQGVLFAAAGAIGFSGKAVIVKLCYRYGVDAVTVLMLRMLFALPLFLALSVSGPHVLLGSAILCTFLPVLMVMLAIERVGAPIVAQTGNIGPLATIFLSILLLNEPFTAWLAAGTALVLSGIWLLARRR